MDVPLVSNVTKEENFREKGVFDMDPSSLAKSIESLGKTSDCSNGTVIEVKPQRRVLRFENTQAPCLQFNVPIPQPKPKVIYSWVPPERIKFCPECKAQGLQIRVEREQFHKQKYYVSCPRMNTCWFCEEYRGKAVVNTRDLTKCGLPENLGDYLDIYDRDIDKIVRIILSQYMQKFIAKPDAESLLLDEDLRTILACFDGLEDIVKSLKPMNPAEGVDKHLQSLIDDGFYVKGVRPTTMRKKPVKSKQKATKVSNIKEHDEQKPEEEVNSCEGNEVIKLKEQEDNAKEHQDQNLDGAVNNDERIEVIDFKEQKNYVKEYNEPKPCEEVTNYEEIEVIKLKEQEDSVEEHNEGNLDEGVSNYKIIDVIELKEQENYVKEHNERNLEEGVSNYEGINVIEFKEQEDYVKEHIKQNLEEQVNNDEGIEVIEFKEQKNYVKEHNEPKTHEEVINFEGIDVIELKELEDYVKRHNEQNLAEEMNDDEGIEVIEPGHYGKEHDEQIPAEDVNNDEEIVVKENDKSKSKDLTRYKVQEICKNEDDVKDHEETKLHDDKNHNDSKELEEHEHAAEVNKIEEEVSEHQEEVNYQEEDESYQKKEESYQKEEESYQKKEEIYQKEEESYQKEEVNNDEEELTEDAGDFREDVKDFSEDAEDFREDSEDFSEDSEDFSDEEEDVTEFDLLESVKLLATTLVADLPMQYRLKVKSAFSEIEGYNFPDDFVNILKCGKVKLRRVFGKIDPDDEAKVKLLETLNKTLNCVKEYFNMVDGLRQKYCA